MPRPLSLEVRSGTVLVPTDAPRSPCVTTTQTSSSTELPGAPLHTSLLLHCGLHILHQGCVSAGSWAFLALPPFAGSGLLVDVHSILWLGLCPLQPPVILFLFTCQWLCHTPWIQSLINTAHAPKLLIQHSHSSIITPVSPACLWNCFYLHKIQDMEE